MGKICRSPIALESNSRLRWDGLFADALSITSGLEGALERAVACGAVLCIRDLTTQSSPFWSTGWAVNLPPVTGHTDGSRDPAGAAHDQTMRKKADRAKITLAAWRRR